jgi:hypothetical protein
MWERKDLGTLSFWSLRKSQAGVYIYLVLMDAGPHQPNPGAVMACSFFSFP